MEGGTICLLKVQMRTLVIVQSVLIRCDVNKNNNKISMWLIEGFN